MKQQTLGILFSDIKGFSSLKSGELELYATDVVPKIASIIDKYRKELVEVNTWGDGFFILSKSQSKLAELALEIRDFFKHTNWQDLHLSQLDIRIALHSADVFIYQNRISNSSRGAKLTGCVGTQVNVAARVEPITPPGHIWTTSVFKEIVDSSGSNHAFKFEEVGLYSLPKNGGTLKLWHLMRTKGDETSPKPPASIVVQPMTEQESHNRYKLRHERLSRCSAGETVKFIAITGRGAFLPRTQPAQGLDELPIPSAVKRGVKMKLILLDPTSNEALFRSAVESGSSVPTHRRLLQRDAKDLADSLVEIYSKELNISKTFIQKNIQMKRTRIGISFSLWLFNDIAIIEPHHFGKENSNMNLCHFASLVIPVGNREFKLLVSHFDQLWNDPASKPLTLV